MQKHTNNNTSDIFAEDFQSKSEMIEHLSSQSGVLKSDSLKHAFEKVDRKDFVPDDYRIECYEDYPLPIGFGQTLSQPTTVAFMLELLRVEPGNTILDIGSGSGWTTALLSELVGNEGSVVGVEVIPELVLFGTNNLEKYSYPWAEIRQGQGGIPFYDDGPFDRILLSASIEEIPQELIDQLKQGGIFVGPIGDTLVKIEKNGEKIQQSEFPGFNFVPFKY